MAILAIALASFSLGISVTALLWVLLARRS
jgi:hypothetical protein